MGDILDPASGPYVLTTNTGPTTALYTPNTTANYTGDGDVDDYVLARTDGTAFDESTGFCDTNATASQIIAYSLLPTAMDVNGNARCYVGSVVDAATPGAKNAGMGYYIEHGGPNNAGDVGIKFGNIANGAKVTFANDLVAGTQYWYTVTYDPAADTVTLDIYTDSARTALMESSGALDQSIGPDSQAGGLPVFQALDVTARGKGAAPYQLRISEVALNQVPAGPPTEIREIVKDSAGVAYADGTSVHVYNADGTLAFSGTVGTTFGADTTHASISSITAGTGTVSVTFANADLATRSISVDAAVDTDGLITNLIAPTQLV